MKTELATPIRTNFIHSVLINFSFENYFQEYFKISQHLTMTNSTRNNMRRDRGTADSSSPLSTMGWVSLLLSMSANVSAFNAGAKQPLAMTLTPGAFVRELASSTDFYGISDSATVGFAISSRSRPLHTISTRLQYSDGNEDNVTAESSPSSSNKWWGNAFSSADAEIEEDNQQEVVDEYLEFLDRRYRRLRNTEPAEEKHKPFSALNWLKQGSPKSNDGVASKQQQQEDALYALGVAGLASQKLLQKHHVAHQEEQGPRPTSAITIQQRPIPIRHESSTQVAANASSYSEPQVGSTFANKVIRPVVRVLCSIEHRKQHIRAEVQKLRSVLSVMVKSIAKSLIQGLPISTMKAVLEGGGGKKSFSLTFTVASTLCLLLRSMLQAVVMEIPPGAESYRYTVARNRIFGGAILKILLII
jgi:hypothetical protein